MANGKYRVQDTRTFETFKKNLKALMDSHGYNMKEMGIALDMNNTSICRYFQDRNPDLISLWRIADRFNVSMDWLVGRTDSRYDALSPELQRLVNLYSRANETDKAVVDMLLSKYDKDVG